MRYLKIYLTHKNIIKIMDLNLERKKLQKWELLKLFNKDLVLLAIALERCERHRVSHPKATPDGTHASCAGSPKRIGQRGTYAIRSSLDLDSRDNPIAENYLILKQNTLDAFIYKAVSALTVE